MTFQVMAALALQLRNRIVESQREINDFLPQLHDGMKPGLSSVLQRWKDKQVKSNPHVWNPKYTHKLGYGLCLLITLSYICIYIYIIFILA